MTSSAPQQVPRINSYDIHRATVLVIGQTGTGKTTFIETLKNRQYQPQTRVLNSRTEKATLNSLGFQIGPENYDLTIIDTPGLGDNTGKPDVAIKSLILEFVKAGITALNMVLIAVPMGRVIDGGHISTINTVLEFLGPEMRDITYILGTYADGMDKQKKQKWAESLLNGPLDLLVTFAQRKFVFSGLVPMALKGTNKELVLRSIKASQEGFLKKAVSQQPLELITYRKDERSKEIYNRFKRYDSISKDLFLVSEFAKQTETSCKELCDYRERLLSLPLSEEERQKLDEVFDRYADIRLETIDEMKKNMAQKIRSEEYEAIGREIAQAAREVIWMHTNLTELSNEGYSLRNHYKIIPGDWKFEKEEEEEEFDFDL